MLTKLWNPTVSILKKNPEALFQFDICLWVTPTTTIFFGEHMDAGWHEILEPDELLPLMADARNGVFAVPILFWLKQNLSASPGWASRGLEIDVIGAGMAGYYPALGIRLLSWSSEASANANDDVTRLAREILQQRPISDFLQFVANDKSDWCAIYQDLIARQQPQSTDSSPG